MHGAVDVHGRLVHCIHATLGCGYDKPSSSQQVGVPAMLAGSTVLIGSRACGKTGAVVIVAAQMLVESVNATQVALRFK